MVCKPNKTSPPGGNDLWGAPSVPISRFPYHPWKNIEGSGSLLSVCYRLFAPNTIGRLKNTRTRQVGDLSVVGVRLKQLHANSFMFSGSQEARPVTQIRSEPQILNTSSLLALTQGFPAERTGGTWPSSGVRGGQMPTLPWCRPWTKPSANSRSLLCLVWKIGKMPSK